MPFALKKKPLMPTSINVKTKLKPLTLNSLKNIMKKQDSTKLSMKIFSAEFKSIKSLNS